MTIKRPPFDAEHVQLVEEPGNITAMWIEAPEKAKDPHKVLDAPPTFGSA